ncbi:hypothetical protein SAMN04488074_10597 [Lentzea albidocapillata subsp. violacea]|uniref:Uncharacterized protein n=1 Tax=Lentzea albidocapillata subsp. violacea TaxID=128104 RepID=A0A1G9AR43_9PSEU|nr:hypothetical protein [Lentzea albidocapillata]SDK29852.1 hypothetical protein SAMN04488074_10597 [Lentzea albidocapillata subsp. violacea]
MRDVGSWLPVTKVAGGGAAGAAATVVLWVLTDLLHLQVSAGVAAAIGVLVTFGVAYIVPAAAAPDEDEQPLTEDERQVVLATVEQLTRDATLTLRVRGPETAQRELARDLSAFLERRRDQQPGGG